MEQRNQSPSAAPAIALPLLAVLAAIAMFQVGASLAKFLFAQIGPEGTTALRLLFSAIMLLAVIRPWRIWPERPAWKAVVVLGIAIAVMNLLAYLALARLPQGLMIAIEFTGPLAVAVLASRRPLDFLWVAIAVAGLSQLVPWPGSDARIDPLGVVYSFGAGAAWGTYILAGKPASASFGTGASALASTLGALLVVPLALHHVGAALFTPSLLPLAILVAAVSSAIPYTLELHAMPHIPARTFGVLMSLEPAVGALSGFVLWGERLSTQQWLAVAAVIVASAGSVLTGRAAAAAEPG